MREMRRSEIDSLPCKSIPRRMRVARMGRWDGCVRMSGRPGSGGQIGRDEQLPIAAMAAGALQMRVSQRDGGSAPGAFGEQATYVPARAAAGGAEIGFPLAVDDGVAAQRR